MDNMFQIYQTPEVTKFIWTHIWIWLLKSSREKKIETRYWACFFKSNQIQLWHKSCVLWHNRISQNDRVTFFPTILWSKVSDPGSSLPSYWKKKKRDMITLGNTLSLYLNFSKYCMQARPYHWYICFTSHTFCWLLSHVYIINIKLWRSQKYAFMDYLYTLNSCTCLLF
jgi:hypothetical protein